jgi:ribosomal protein L16/L10AE
MVLPNFILTQKSKNARMGAGVGKFVRLVSVIKPGKSVLKM